MKCDDFRGKLHFTILNYAINYTLHPKLFECIVCILNYDYCYTLHPNVSFNVKLDGNMIFLNLSLSLSLRINPSLNQNPWNPKFPNQNHLHYHHYSTTATSSLTSLVRGMIFFPSTM